MHYNAEFDDDYNLILVDKICTSCGVSKSIKVFPKLYGREVYVLKCFECTPDYNTKEAATKRLREYQEYFKDQLNEDRKRRYHEKKLKNRPKDKFETKRVKNETVFIIDGDEIPLRQFDTTQLKAHDLSMNLLWELAALHKVKFRGLKKMN